MRSPIYYDNNDTTYYVDPNSSSRLHNVTIRNYGLRLERNYTHNAIWFAGGTDANHVMWQDYYGGPAGRGGANSGFDGILWSAYRGIQIRGGLGGAYNLIRATNSSGNVNDHIVQLYAANTEQLGTRAGYGFAPNQMRSPIYYDSNNTGYYVDPNSTSNLLGLTVANRISGSITGCTFTQDSADKDNITTRTDSGFYQTSSGTTGEGWPINTNSWQHMISCTHSNDGNYYAMQLAANFFGQELWYRSTNSSGSTGWSRVALYNNYFAGALYATIFYDANNTGFYADPNGTSNFNALNVSNLNGYSPNNFGRFRWSTGLFDDGTSTANFISDLSQNGHLAQGFTAHKVPWWYAGNSDVNTGIQSIEMAGCAVATWHDGSYYTSLVIRPTTGAGGGAVYIYNDQGSTYSPGWRQVWTSSTDCFNYNSIRSPIFYDINNTGYYVDPASTSNFNEIYAFSYRGNGNVGGTGNASWHPNGIYSAGYNWLYGGINGGNNSATNFSDMRARTFYDYDDTAFYVDPRGTSRIGALQISVLNDAGTHGIYFRGVNGDNPGGYNHTAVLERLWGTTDQSELLLFKGNDPDTGTIHDRVRIAASGRVVIHSFTEYRDVISYMAAYTGNINGSGFWYGNTLHNTGNIIAYYSDERLKDKISNVDNALEKILSLTPFVYKHNELAKQFGYEGDHEQIGLSAQEVQKVLPQLVERAPFDTDHVENEDGTVTTASVTGEDYLTLNYERLVPVLVGAMKEQQEMINKQNDIINNQQNEINELKSMVSALIEKLS